MGPEIGTAQPIDSTPLLVIGKVGGEVDEDLTTENLFIKSWWSDLTSHLFIVLATKLMNEGLLYPYRIVTDREILDIRLGKQGYNAKSKSKRDEVLTFNSLSDFIGKEQRLVILRLGFLGYKNQAMAGFVKEALLCRQADALPTWIVEEPDSIFGPGHLSYNEDVGDYIASRYRIIDLTKPRSGLIIPRGVEGAQVRSTKGMAVDGEDTVPSKVPMPEPRFVAPARPRIEMDDSCLGMNGGSKKKDWNKKGNRGGGPV